MKDMKKDQELDLRRTMNDRTIISNLLNDKEGLMSQVNYLTLQIDEYGLEEEEEQQDFSHL